MKSIYSFFFALFIIVFGVFSCTKGEREEVSICENKLSEQEALEDFAIILSKTITNNEEMRVFLKEEALKEFDKDNDVFYPYVKNHVFSSGKTFQQELAAYEEYENQLNDIEMVVPKLTILVPDFAWVDSNCFSVRSWDTAREGLCVGYDDHEDEHSLFYKGALVGKLPATEFPSFPVLIVKNNERMCVTTTKSGHKEYSFADPAFDGSLDMTKGWTYGYNEGYLDNPSPDYDAFSQMENFVSVEELELISPELIQAYEEFPDEFGPGVQRDFIYYNMTKSNSSSGRLKGYMRDLLYRIRLTTAGINFITDDDGDPRQFTTQLNTGRGDRPDFEQALPRLIAEWGGGRYELRLEFFQGYPTSGTARVGGYPISVAPEEIMSVNKCFRTFQWNFFGNNWSSYSISLGDVESKWYYPGDNNNVLHTSGTSWNLFSASDNLFLRVLEFDSDGTKTVSQTCTCKTTNVVSAEASGEYLKINYGVNGSKSKEETRSDVYSYTISTGADDLLDCEINYVNNYLVSKAKNNNQDGYVLRDFGNDYYAVSFLPIDTRNDYQIRQSLLGRKGRIK